MHPQLSQSGGDMRVKCEASGGQRRPSAKSYGVGGGVLAEGLGLQERTLCSGTGGGEGRGPAAQNRACRGL